MKKLLTIFLFLITTLTTLGANFYVALDGSDTAPYDTWAKAATNIQDAINACSTNDIVWVSNGVYHTTATLVITNGVEVRAMNSRQVKIEPHGSGAFRGVYIRQTGLISGFEICGFSNAQGAGVYIARDGIVEDCLIVSNRYTTTSYGGGVYLDGNVTPSMATCRWSTIEYNLAYTQGGGVYAYGGNVENCIIRRNLSPAGAAGVYAGQRYCYIRNCLITENNNYSPADENRVGGLYLAGDSYGYVWVYNCTIVKNRGNPGGVLISGTGHIRSCIIWGNGSPINKFGDYTYNIQLGEVEDSCIGVIAPQYDGLPYLINCVTNDPQFVDFENDDFRLLPTSPYIDIGDEYTWMTTSVTNDLNENNRIVQGQYDNKPDYGCYEYQDTFTNCAVSVPARYKHTNEEFSFTLDIGGSNVAVKWYGIDFENDGEIDFEGTDNTQTVATTYTFPSNGSYSILTLITNSADDTISNIQSNYIRVGPYLVQTNSGGADAFPWNTWANAATNLQDVLNVAIPSSTIIMSNGIYQWTNQYVIRSSVTITSVNGYTETAIRGGDTWRCMINNLSYNTPTISGLSFVNGTTNTASTYYGGGVYQIGGEFISCRAVSNGTWGSGKYYGGGAYFQGTKVRDSIFEYNKVSGAWQCWGGGAYMEYSGLFTNCIFRFNHGNAGVGGGAKIYSGGEHADDPVIVNCLFYANKSRGGGADAARCDFYNCTFTANTNESSGQAGGIGFQYGKFYNNIVWGNIDPWNLESNIDETVTGVTFSYNCIGPAQGATDIEVDPEFVGDGDYHLQSSRGTWNDAITNWTTYPNESPCIDAGNPNYSYENEPEPNGDRLNMGAYGNTPYASKTWPFPYGGENLDQPVTILIPGLP